MRGIGCLTRQKRHFASNRNEDSVTPTPPHTHSWYTRMWRFPRAIALNAGTGANVTSSPLRLSLANGDFLQEWQRGHAGNIYSSSPIPEVTSSIFTRTVFVVSGRALTEQERYKKSQATIPKPCTGPAFSDDCQLVAGGCECVFHRYQCVCCQLVGCSIKQKLL